MKTRALLYARVSGDDYDDDELSKLDAQLTECRKYAEKKQYKVLHEFQEDMFSSGAVQEAGAGSRYTTGKALSALYAAWLRDPDAV